MMRRGKSGSFDVLEGGTVENQTCPTFKLVLRQ